MNSPGSNRRNDSHPIANIILLVLALLLPAVVLFLLPFGMVTNFWILVALMVVISTILLLIRMRSARNEIKPEMRMLFADEQPPVIQEIMDVKLATEEEGIRIYRGPLLQPASEAFKKLQANFGESYVPLLQQDNRLGAAVWLVPRPIERELMEHQVKLWKHWVLFFLTALTTMWAGAMYQGIDVLRNPAGILAGLPYSIALLAILGVHEMGHYFAAKFHGMRVTPPYFIPVPFALGTFGAFIQLRSPSENRCMLFDVAVAGPLAGLVIAIPALWFGLKGSELVPIAQPFGGGLFGSSILFTLIAKLALGSSIEPGLALKLSPLAFAGWLGLIVTAINLMPIGQLDGGHTARAMFGHRVGSTISNVAMWSLLLAAMFIWPELMLWALIVVFLARRTSPPLNDITPITPGRRILGYVTFGILAIIILPFPKNL